MNRTIRILNLVFFIAMIIVNVLGEYLPLGAGTTGSISAKYENLFTPAPITFAIWGIIYLLLAFFVLYQMGPKFAGEYSNQVVKAVGLWFIVSCIMNICWMLSWHYEKIGLSLICMIGLLLSLIFITAMYQQLTNIPRLARVAGYGFYIYLGWICAATIANVSVLLVKLNWNGFGIPDQLWTMIVILVGAALGVLFILTKRNYISAAAIIWAYAGILVKHISQSGYAGKYPLIIITTIIAIVIILITGVARIISYNSIPIETK